MTPNIAEILGRLDTKFARYQTAKDIGPLVELDDARNSLELELVAYYPALRAEIKRLQKDNKALQQEMRDERQSSAAEAVWKERQGEDYGSY